MASGLEKTNRIPVESLKKMESGRVIEDFWREVYTRAGYLVVSPLPPASIGAMRSMGGDGLLFVETKEAAESSGLPKGSSLLLELKDLGAWSYMDFVLKGCEAGLPDYYDQIQSYLQAYGRDYCVFHAGMADASGTKFIWSRIKRQTDPCPPFWVEIVKRDSPRTMQVLSRASEIKWAIDNIHPDDRIPIELKDFDSEKLVPEHKYPCGYCGFADLCVKASGIRNITSGRD
jgi:hypothetical protein